MDIAPRPPTLGEILRQTRVERKESAADVGDALAKLSKRSKPWSYQMITAIETGERLPSAPLAKDIGQYLGIGGEVALLIAGHMPFLPTVDQAQRVVEIFRGNGA